MVSNRGKNFFSDFLLGNGIQINCCGFIKKFEVRFTNGNNLMTNFPNTPICVQMQ